MFYLVGADDEKTYHFISKILNCSITVNKHRRRYLKKKWKIQYLYVFEGISVKFISYFDAINNYQQVNEIKQENSLSLSLVYCIWNLVSNRAWMLNISIFSKVSLFCFILHKLKNWYILLSRSQFFTLKDTHLNIIYLYESSIYILRWSVTESQARQNYFRKEEEEANIFRYP